MGRHRPRSHSEIQMRDIHFHAQLTQTSLLTKHRPRINRTPVTKDDIIGEALDPLNMLAVLCLYGFGILTVILLLACVIDRVFRGGK